MVIPWRVPILKILDRSMTHAVMLQSTLSPASSMSAQLSDGSQVDHGLLVWIENTQRLGLGFGVLRPCLKVGRDLL
jgi:hypothetical protein